jgi:hypothetical protein
MFGVNPECLLATFATGEGRERGKFVCVAQINVGDVVNERQFKQIIPLADRPFFDTFELSSSREGRSILPAVYTPSFSLSLQSHTKIKK